MGDSINRQAAVDVIRKCNVKEVTPAYMLIDKAEAMTELMMLPSAEPDVIRCKDCKYWDMTWQNDFAPNYHYCPLVDGTRRSDFYCADAERRTDE